MFGTFAKYQWQLDYTFLKLNNVEGMNDPKKEKGQKIKRIITEDNNTELCKMLPKKFNQSNIIFNDKVINL